jgi:ferric-dicitrate binding protein FerR (iron transport regulator)
MQTPDKKKQMFLDMQEHPEKYSEEQIETMMDDLDRLPDVDVAWQEFQQTGQSSPRRWLKAAASIIGVLMLSGIAYAAVHIISRNAGVDEETPTHEVQNINSPLNDDAIVETFTTDSIPQTRIFENTPLDEMVSEIAHYYNKVADIQSEEAHELRLYYKWERKDALESVVDDLNHFDRVSLAIEDDKLIVKP